VGLERGFFANALGPEVNLEPKVFKAGGEAVEAIFTGALDATYIGPNPAINAFIKSDGAAVRILAGATSGGAAMVVRDGIDTAADLKGTKIATPGLGNTQDVALRFWLSDNGLTATEAGAGDVSIQPLGNADALSAFISGDIDGGWVPEPWATRMQVEGKGHVLVDERDLWPNGQFVTTQLVVAKPFLDAHPDVVKRLLEGDVAADSYLAAQPIEAQPVVATAIERLTRSTMSPDIVSQAWGHLTFTVDPLASSLFTSAEHAHALDFITSEDLDGIYDLTLLNEVLTETNAPTIPQP
jgi:sulfonate transport system substrate-binding protein